MKHTPPPFESLKGHAKPVSFVKFAHRDKATVERVAIWIPTTLAQWASS